MSTLRVATVAWKLRPIRGTGDFFAHFYDLIEIAHQEGAEVVVLPENQSLELLSLAPDIEEKDVPAYLIQFSDELEEWIGRISRSSGLIVVGGSHLRETEEGIKNVSAVASPDGTLVRVEKNNLTNYERDVWRLAPGSGLRVLSDPRIGVTICYDSEFPEAGRALAENGVLVHVIPAFTETLRGFQRVRWSARARAIENQVYVVHSALVGSLGREPVPWTYGSAAILTPSIEPFVESSNLGETEPNEEGVIVRTLDFDLLSEARSTGDVRNWEDRHRATWDLS